MTLPVSRIVCRVVDNGIVDRRPVGVTALGEKRCVLHLACIPGGSVTGGTGQRRHHECTSQDSGCYGAPRGAYVKHSTPSHLLPPSSSPGDRIIAPGHSAIVPIDRGTRP